MNLSSHLFINGLYLQNREVEIFRSIEGSILKNASLRSKTEIATIGFNFRLMSFIPVFSPLIEGTMSSNEKLEMEKISKFPESVRWNKAFHVI